MPKKSKKQLKIEAWHRWPGESELAYNLFRLYLEMADERSLPKVVEESGRKYRLIAQLSSKFKWSYRAKAYDDYVYSIQESAVERTLQKDAIVYARRRSVYREKEYSIASQLLDQAQQMLAAPLYEREIIDKVIVNGQEIPTKIILKPARWNKATAKSYVRTAAEIIRLNLEMETQRIGVVRNNEDPAIRLQMARASLEKWIKNLDQLVDEQVHANPTLDRAVVSNQILQQLPMWCAADHKLTPDQMPLLTQGIHVTSLSEMTYDESPEDALPFPMDDDMEPESDLTM